MKKQKKKGQWICDKFPTFMLSPSKKFWHYNGLGPKFCVVPKIHREVTTWSQCIGVKNLQIVRPPLSVCHHFWSFRNFLMWNQLLLRILISSYPLFSFYRFSTSFAYLFPPIPNFHFFLTPDKRFPESLFWRFSTNFAYLFPPIPYFHFLLTPDKRFPESLFWRFSTNFAY